MKIAYIITVYHKPEQLVRLIRNLNTDYSYFYVHLDSTKDIALFQNSFYEVSRFAKIKFLKRQDSRWGRWGFTKAMINGLIEANKEKDPFDYIITLSGQDQPIKSNNYIEEFFEKNKNKNFIEHFPIPNPEWHYGGLDRLEHFHFDFLGREYAYPPKKKLKSVRDRILTKIYSTYFSLPRKFPAHLKPFGGSCWFCLTGDTIKYILNFLNENPDYMKYHKYTYLADEIFFQTILLNAKDEAILNSIENQNLIYLEWRGERHVVVFNKEDYHKLADSDKLFARKFDLDQDSQILNLVEQKLLN